MQFSLPMLPVVTKSLEGTISPEAHSPLEQGPELSSYYWFYTLCSFHW